MTQDKGLAVMAAEWYGWEDPMAMRLYKFWGFFNLNYERKGQITWNAKAYEELTFHATRKRSIHPENHIIHSKNSVDATASSRCCTRRWKAVIWGAEGDLKSGHPCPNTWKREQPELRSDGLRQKMIVGVDVMAPNA